MKSVLFAILVVVFLPVSAQIGLSDAVSKKRSQISRTGTAVLGTWGALNLTIGLIGQANSAGTQKSFHRVNAVSGGINLALAGIGLLATNRNTANSVAENFRQQRQIEKLFLFNTALDAGYIVYSLYTKEKALRYQGERRARLTGTGQSLLLQGSFLLLFDGLLYALHTRNGNKLVPLLQNLSFYGRYDGFSVTCHF